MRLLRQISLEGNTRRHSSSSFSKSCSNQSADHIVRDLSDTISTVTGLFCKLSICDANEVSLKESFNLNLNTKPHEEPSTILRVLEELNSRIVSLIRLISDKENLQNVNKEKPKSKIRRQYSAFVESDQFQRIRRSFSRQDSDSSGGEKGANIYGKTSPSPSSSPPNNDTFSALALQGTNSQPNTTNGCNIEEAIRKLLESQILGLLLQVLPYVGFEEKKLIRIILTNSMILKVNQKHLVVEHICEPCNNFLKSLVQSYEFGRSDVTLNCGAILRFVSQYESIVSTILQSEYFYQFFEYMQRPHCSYPFDVAMDVFLTFKTILTRHKTITMAILQSCSIPFFNAFIELLHSAEVSENYVAKRQTLEIFSDIFSGQECVQFRSDFISQEHYLHPVIQYLWSRNLQIRLRCLVLLSKLFILSDTSIPSQSQVKSENDCSNQWQVHNFVVSVAIAQTKQRQHSKQSPLTDSEMRQWMVDTFNELRKDCYNSNVKHFTSKVPFIDCVIQFLNFDSNYECSNSLVTCHSIF